MIWLTYDEKALQDGVGSQAQRILSIYLIAKIHGWKYKHVSMFTISRGVTKTVVDQFNRLIDLPSDECPQSDQLIPINMKHINVAIIKHLANQTRHYLIKIIFAHPYIDSHPQVLQNPFPYNFDWIQTAVQRPVIVCIHVRRGDVSLTENQSRYIPLEYYLDCLDMLHRVLNSHQIPYEFHLHSETSLLQEWKPSAYRLKLHLDEDISKTFQDLVNADIFIAGFSSISYSAMMLRKKGCVLYPQFWHKYPSRAIYIKRPQDILNYQDTILNSI